MTYASFLQRGNRRICDEERMACAERFAPSVPMSALDVYFALATLTEDEILESIRLNISPAAMNAKIREEAQRAAQSTPID